MRALLLRTAPRRSQLLFTSQHSRALSYFYQEVHKDETDKLLFYQKSFQLEPTSGQAAFMYFRELNRQGKFGTVIRLYAKHYDEFVHAKMPPHDLDRIKLQADYAQDTLTSVE